MAKIIGKAAWAKVGLTEDNYDDYQGKLTYKIDIYPSASDMAKYKEAVLKKYTEEKDLEPFVVSGKELKLPDEPTHISVRTDSDGKEFLQLSTNVMRKDKKTGETYKAKVPVFQKDGQPFTGEAIGNGSTVIADFSTNLWKQSPMKGLATAGIKARLNAIMIKDLVSFGNTAESFGFDVEKPSDAYFHGSEEDVPI